jgi:hypothetical protein
MPSKRLLLGLVALGLISLGLNAPSAAVALAAGAGLHMEMSSSRSIAGLTPEAAAATIHETKFIPPSGPREACFTRCRSDVTACKNYAHATTANDVTCRTI